MKKYTYTELRDIYTDFFQRKNHEKLESFPLVPKDDNSLLLINAGMAPLKKYFTGAVKPPNNRLTTYQKCIRTGDIESVGKTARHCTFFEMLGNFSFGDYFKKEAIMYAWEFLTKVLEIPEDKLYISVYKEDEDAINCWIQNTSVKKDRIFKLGKEDNFWEIGVGPCGPCSEIYYCFSDEKIETIERFNELQEEGEFFEIWNLVFTQFNKTEDGEYEVLKNKNIDTGMGLERLALIMQNVKNVFDTDVFVKIIDKIEELAEKKFVLEKDIYSSKVIADHVRSIVFLISDGVIPSNEGRGYVLRRLIRRSIRHGKLLGINYNFLNIIVEVVIDEYKATYKELVERNLYIKTIIDNEEDNFSKTLNKGIEILNVYINELSKDEEKILEGIKAFRLYDTYGFPLELTQEIVKDKNIIVDIVGFNKEMEQQQKKAREARKSDSYIGNDLGILNSTEGYETKFRGYDEYVIESEICDIICENEFVSTISEGEKGVLICSETTFYPEMGGQIGDYGIIESQTASLKVESTKKNIQGQIYHIVECIKGNLKKGDKVVLKVDRDRRRAICRNHTATHILQQALKNVLGSHVKQSGAFYDDHKLRFDFTHFKALTREELSEVEEIVNRCIYSETNVNTEIMDIKSAQQKGAVALFDEKYEDNVRVLSIGDFSMELCGGTHVKNTGLIGNFVIINETSVASGVRRIEAVTGENSYNVLRANRKLISQAFEQLKISSQSEFISKLNNIVMDLKNKDTEISRLISEMINNKLKNLDDILKNAKDKDGIKIMTNIFEGIDVNGLRDICQKIKDKVECAIVCIAAINDEKINVIMMATKTAVEKGIDCGKIIRDILGTGGGRKDMAQGAATDRTKIKEALDRIYEII